MGEKSEQSLVQEFSHTSQPSWIDHLIKWINNLSGPVWLYYIIGFLACVLLINAVFWIDGSMPLGSIHPVNSSFAIFIVCWIWLYSYLTKIGSQALKKFLPLLTMNEHDIAHIEHELAILPRWIGGLMILLGIGFASIDILSEPAPYEDIVPRTALPYVGDIALSGFMISILFSLIIRSIRQLRMVRWLHAQAANIDLLKLEPAHAFSSLSARTGIGIVMILVIAFLVDPSSFDTKMSIISTAVILLLAIGIFVWPIIGIRDDLEEEKARVLDGISDILNNTLTGLHDKLEKGDYQNVPAMEKGITALIQERELFARISTWPWDLRTLRSFASTLLVPVFLLVISRLVDRFF